ncbi:MAG TPA: sigma 54-interacting transcriptional regulator [Polyangiaceae bacterium]|nr:sigma 54-interacting transcriptional regulator [Polyangiaceae bacterium]
MDNGPSTMNLGRVQQGIAFCAELQDEAGTRTVPLPLGSYTVGTARSCALVIDDPTVSAEHLVLAVREDSVVVRDAGSKNGTYVGPARVAEASAEPGTIVTIGRSTLTLRARSPHDDAGAAAAPIDGIIGGSVAIRRVFAQVRRLAPMRFPVLVCGETGSGKELVAQALHTLSPRAHRVFYPINVTSVPRELVESEFFGHEKGSFTGAVSRRRGAFEMAEGGTLFLDEVGDLPVEAQPKLLRALDGYGVRAVGGGSTERRDVRVIAATHVSLPDRVRQGTFRRDLYHRLEVFTIAVPPLRERRGDIAAIARFLLEGMDADVGRRELTSAALARLAAEQWPGNVRELRNALARAAALAPASLIDAAHVDLALASPSAADSGPVPQAVTPSVAKALLREHRGNVSAAARAAGYARSTFRKLLVR